MADGGDGEVKWSELTQFDSLMWQPMQRSLTFGSSNWQNFPSYTVALPRSSSRQMRTLNEQDVRYSCDGAMVRSVEERNGVFSVNLNVCQIYVTRAIVWVSVNEWACECQYQQTTNQTKFKWLIQWKSNGKVSFRFVLFRLSNRIILYYIVYLMKANRSFFNDFISTLPLIRTGCHRFNLFDSR